MNRMKMLCYAMLLIGLLAVVASIGGIIVGSDTAKTMNSRNTQYNELIDKAK